MVLTILFSSFLGRGLNNFCLRVSFSHLSFQRFVYFPSPTIYVGFEKGESFLDIFVSVKLDSFPFWEA